MILAAIRTHTRRVHEDLEAQLDLLRPDLTLIQYVALLERLSGLYAPLEGRLAGQLPAVWQARLEFAARRKADLLRTDLRALGHEHGTLPLPELPELPSEAAAWGALYVLEGATLGGQIICRHLAERLRLTPQTGLSFYASYGPLVGPRWKAFCALLEERAAREGEGGEAAAAAFVDAAVQGAQDTFACFAAYVAPALSGPAQAVPA